jgi:ABC-type glutathione transport system ATPase component
VIADTVYQLSDVVKRYRKGRGEVLALRGVDLVIRDGEWLAIQGPTGHGKSTLLQILGGLDRPTSDHGARHPRQRHGRTGAAPRPDEKRPVRGRPRKPRPVSRAPWRGVGAAR